MKVFLVKEKLNVNKIMSIKPNTDAHYLHNQLLEIGIIIPEVGKHFKNKNGRVHHDQTVPYNVNTVHNTLLPVKTEAHI